LPFIDKVLNIFSIYFAIGTAVNIWVLEMNGFFYAQLLFNLYFVVVFLFGVTIILSTYYLAFYKKDIVAKFYSFVWTLIAFVGLLLPLVYLNVIQIKIHSDYLVQFLILIEVLCFSFILALKIKVIEQEKKEQTKLLVQQNKLASMGEMISAIAHQWRQPLSEINGVILSLDLDYKKKKLSPESFNNYLDSLELTTSYLSNTIHDFMDFFQQNKQAELVFISEIIHSSLKLISVSHAHNIEIIYEKNEEIQLYTYKSELIQALLIVINNAIDACLDNQEKFSKIILKAYKENSDLSIVIVDNGKGIPDALLEKIYTPYFTTKHKSKGTGLGLYILKMIIEGNMNGKIHMKSSKSGTHCELIIPLNCE
jgi:signal transduction histidine kinase